MNQQHDLQYWLATLTIIAVLMMLFVPVARAHTLEDQAVWYDEWATDVVDAGGLTGELLGERNAFQARHNVTPSFNAGEPLKGTPPSLSIGVEQWRPLVAEYFPAGRVDEALRVMWCESRGVADAANSRSSARGLFQHLGRYWNSRSAAAGVPGASILDPEANVIVAAWLAGQGGSYWHHWAESRHCHGL